MPSLSARKDVISKSQYLKGLQCPKALWLYRYRKGLAAPFSKETEQRLAMGHSVGELAKQYFSRFGPVVEVHAPFWDIDGAARQTRSLLAEGESVIFEAAAIGDGRNNYSRIDVLRRQTGQSLELIEVKAATRVKPYHIEDMAFQYQVFASAGFGISACYMMLIDSSYIRHGDLELDKLFQLCDISSAVLSRQNKVAKDSTRLCQMLKNQNEPEQAMGDQCHKPFVCDYIHYCEALPSARQSKQKNETQGSPSGEGPHSLNNPLGNELFPAGQTKASGNPKAPKNYRIRPKYLTSWLDSLEYPLYFLDYECFQTVLPYFDQSRPYQMIPFQFSLHILQGPEAALEHRSFLHTGSNNTKNGDAPDLSQPDPRPNFIQALLTACGESGSIIVYNQSFESSVNKLLGADFPEARLALRQLNRRMKDLLRPFKNFWLYCPQQRGYTSLKAVLAAFTPLSYDDLAIDNGLDAMNTYLELFFGSGSGAQSPAGQQLRQNLEQYCKRDTFAMYMLLEVLRSELRQKSQSSLSKQEPPNTAYFRFSL